MDQFMEQIPEPEETGGAGTQAATTAKQNTLELIPDVPVYGSNLSDTLRGLAATNTRLMGGDAGTKLLVAGVSTLTQDLQSTKQELQETRKTLSETKDALATANQDKAVLVERLSNLGGIRHLGNLAIVIGTALLGFGYKLIASDLSVGFALFGTGTLMILLAWFAGPMKSKP